MVGTIIATKLAQMTINNTKEIGNIKDHRGLTINTLPTTMEILIKNRMMIATTGPRGTKTNMEKNET